jgi:hypothetical protein
MATQTDTYKRVNFDPDGQGLDFTDLSVLQEAALRAQLEMFLLSGVTDVIENPTNPHSADAPDFESGDLAQSIGLDFDDMLWTPHPSLPAIKPTGVARQLTTGTGVIVQHLQGEEPFNGSEDATLAFRFVSGTNLTTAVGDATNPRIDIVEVKLEVITDTAEMRDFEDATTRAPTTQSHNVAKRTQMTIQIKQGTPAASPTYPTPTAGFTAMAAVWVPANHNAVHSVDNIRDLRWPIGGFRTYDVNANAMYTPGATQWTINETGQYLEAPASGADPVYAICPVSMKSARLLGVGIMGQSDGTPTVELVRITHNAGGAPTITSLATIDYGDIFDNPGGFLKVGSVFLMDVLGDALGAVKGARVANRRIGSAIWCNGHPAGVGKAETLITAAPSQIGIKIAACDPAGTLALVRFYVAHGM